MVIRQFIPHPSPYLQPLALQLHWCRNYSQNTPGMFIIITPKYLSSYCSFTRASLVAQMVKSLPTMQETRVRSLGEEDLLEKEMATHYSTLAWKIPWTEEPGRLQSTRLQSWTRLSDFTSLSPCVCYSPRDSSWLVSLVSAWMSPYQRSYP